MRRPRNTIQSDPTVTFNELVAPREMSARMVGAGVLSVGIDSHYFENTVMRSNGYNLPRVQFISGEMYTPTVIAKRMKAPKLKANVAALQSWIDIMMPGCNHHDTTYDDMQLHHSPFELQLTNKVAFDKRMPWKKPKFQKLRPVLRTAVPEERTKSIQELLLAFQKRNDNVPRLNSLTDVTVVVDLMIDKLKLYFDPDKIHLLDTYREHPIDINEESCEEWFSKQKGLTRPNQEKFIGEMVLNQYDYMIKTRPKPDLSHEAANVRGALQTIAHQTPVDNAIWCPMFRDMKARLLSVLGPRFQIFTDLSILEFEQWMNNTFPDGLIGNKIFELDISKYDKSQGDIALEFDCAVMRLFGFREDYIAMWRQAHLVTEVRNRNAMFRSTLV